MLYQIMIMILKIKTSVVLIFKGRKHTNEILLKIGGVENLKKQGMFKEKADKVEVLMLKLSPEIEREKFAKFEVEVRRQFKDIPELKAALEIMRKYDADISKAKKQLDWAPTRDLTTMVADTLNSMA